MLRKTILAALAGLAVLSGCKRVGPAPPATVAAKGFVRLADGRPLREGRLEFSPKDQGGAEAFGDLAQDGGFTLTSYKANDGAVPGRYVVTVSPYNYAVPGGSPTPVANPGLIPPKYLDQKTSDLEVEIKATDNVLQLQLDRS